MQSFFYSGSREYRTPPGLFLAGKAGAASFVFTLLVIISVKTDVMGLISVWKMPRRKLGGIKLFSVIISVMN